MDRRTPHVGEELRTEASGNGAAEAMIRTRATMLPEPSAAPRPFERPVRIPGIARRGALGRHPSTPLASPPRSADACARHGIRCGVRTAHRAYPAPVPTAWHTAKGVASGPGLSTYRRQPLRGKTTESTWSSRSDRLIRRKPRRQPVNAPGSRRLALVVFQ